MYSTGSEFSTGLIKISDFFHKMHAKCLHYECNLAIIKTVKRGTLTIRSTQ